jgi:DNA modification methylase
LTGLTALTTGVARRAEKLELRQVDALIPYARNARKHSDKQIEKLAASIRRSGFNSPVLVDATGTIIAGHGRVLAARRAGLDQVPVIELPHLNDKERRAYILADNQLAELATWDDALLADELAELDAAGMDLGLIGFSTKELDALLKEPASTAAGGGAREGEDDAPEAAGQAVTQPGDLWLMGGHRLLCGDSTKVDDVRRVLAGAVPLLMVTDPPYGVEYDPAWRTDPRMNKLISHPVKGAVGKVTNDHRADWQEAWAKFPGAVAYVWHGALQSSNVAKSLVTCDFELRAQIIWNKSVLVISRGHYHWKHETCWYAVRKGVTADWAGDRKQSTVWDIEHRKSESGHGTQKPVECMRRPILNHTKPGATVYDPFLGSGTTIIAAETEGRSCYGLEILPAYCDVIVRRWQAFSGKACAA